MCYFEKPCVVTGWCLGVTNAMHHGSDQPQLSLMNALFPPPGSPGDLNLSVVAMALSGYTDERNSLWREMCSSLRSQLRNPYLLVMFAFLTSEPGSYDGVLVRPPPPSDPGTNAQSPGGSTKPRGQSQHS